MEGNSRPHDPNFQFREDATHTKIAHAALDIKYRKLIRRYRQLRDTNTDLERRNTELQGTVSMLQGEQEQRQKRVSRLEAENRNLRNQGEGYKQQIFKLRPFEPYYKAYDIEADFRAFTDGITDWVFKWTDKFFDSGEEFVDRWLSDLSPSKQVFLRFQQSLQSLPDLYQAVGYPDTDQEILSAWVLRFVWKRVFSDFSMKQTAVLSEIELLMSLCKNPPLDMSARQDWRAQAYHALFTDPKYPQIRQRSIDVFSADLAEILAFVPESSQKAAFTQSIRSKLFEPCFEIYEKCQRSDVKYYIEATGSTSEEVSDVVGRLFAKEIRCYNAAKVHAILTLDSLNPRPTPEELKQRLHIIFSIRPALKMQAWKLNNGREQTLQQETLLIAWDSDLVESGNPAQLKEETWLSRICAQ